MAQLYSLAERRLNRAQQCSKRDRLGAQVEVAWEAFHIAHAMWLDQPRAATYLLRCQALSVFRDLSDQYDATPPEGPRAA